MSNLVYEWCHAYFFDSFFQEYYSIYEKQNCSGDGVTSSAPKASGTDLQYNMLLLNCFSVVEAAF